jgi:hypothetical protein
MSFPGKLLKAVWWLLFGVPSQKRRVRQECARLAAGLFGDFPISEDHKLWRTDTEFLTDYQRLSPANTYSQDRKFALREFARFTKNVPGAMAECGCYQGASAFFLAKERRTTPLHLFDSFEGLSELTERDKQSTATESFEWRAGDLRTSEDAVRRALKDFEHVIIHKGWIPDRFADVTGETFSLVHIDVDLYQPTLDSLSFFYPRVNRGGVLVLDDYGFTTCPGAYEAVREFMAGKPEHVLHLPTGQGLIFKP